ncbi:MAG: YhfC family intramembrane metalloprotease [Clostridia bacterium]|nr:YhfC family intramembrane metalloprotease [Clostridia bacterium]
MEYTFEKVPALSIAGMVFSLLVGVLMPVVLLLLWKKKSGASLLSAVAGVGVFIGFVLILEGMVNRLVVALTGEAITGNVWLYALYGGLAAGLFEETGRYLAMRFLMKKDLTRENAVMYGIGHGGIESILILGTSMVSNLTMTAMLNTSGIDAVLQTVPEEMKGEFYNQISALWTTAPSAFFLAAAERISGMALHICLSYLVYRAVKDRRILIFFLAILIHAAIDGVVVILPGVGCPTWAVEIILALMTAALAFFTVKAYRKEGETADKAAAPEA